jgi:hypothetical protein
LKYLRKATAATVVVGPFLDKADGVTLKTALTTGSTLNGRIVSNGTGAAFTPGTFAHDANAHYLCALAAGDVPAAGRLRLEFSDPATYLPVWEDFTVLEANVYDVLFGTTAPSTYAGADTPGTTTLLTRIGGNLTINAGAVTVGTNNDKSGYLLAAAGIDAITVEAGVNARQALSPILAAAGGVLSGAGTGAIIVRAGANPTTTRITATTDGVGNRTSVTFTLPT